MARNHGKLRYVTIKKDDLEAQCLPQAVAAWERNGWTVVDDGTSEEAEEVPFSPADSDVADHNEVLEEEEEPVRYDTNPDDLKYQDEE